MTAVTTTPEGRVLAKDEILAEAERILAIRNKCLVGRTVTGTLYATGKDNKVRHWIKWNHKKCDAVLVRKFIAESLGDKLQLGMTLRATITKLGPDLAKLAYKSAWCMHPECDSVEIVPPTARAYKPKKWTRRTNTTTFNKVRAGEDAGNWRCAPRGAGLEL